MFIKLVDVKTEDNKFILVINTDSFDRKSIIFYIDNNKKRFTFYKLIKTDNILKEFIMEFIEDTSNYPLMYDYEFNPMRFFDLIFFVNLHKND